MADSAGGHFRGLVVSVVDLVAAADRDLPSRQGSGSRAPQRHLVEALSPRLTRPERRCPPGRRRVKLVSLFFSS